MARGKNIRSRKKIAEALETIHSPFTSRDMASLVGEKVARVAALLKELDNVEYIDGSKWG